MKTLSFRYRGGCARVGAWHGRHDVAALALHGTAAPAPATVERMLARLRAAGYREIVTGALPPASSLPFVDAGFAVRGRLHLLAHPLTDLPPAPGTTRRARRDERAGMIEVDTAAFDEFWRLDERALKEAMRATPVRHLRVAEAEMAGTDQDRHRLAGFVLLGRAANDGYVQRLSVHPQVQGQGVGRALLVDGLHWLRNDGATRALVNTQEENERAIALYRGAGFERLPVGLCVLGMQL